MRPSVAESRIQLEIWRTAAEIAAMDPGVTVRLARGVSGDQGLLLRQLGDPITKITLTEHRGIRVFRGSSTITWSWDRVLATDPLSTSAAVIDAAVWAQGSLPISTSAPAASALALAEILTMTSRWGANVRVRNRYNPMTDPAAPYLGALPDFPALRAAVREQAFHTVNYGERVVLDRWWFAEFFGGFIAAVDVESGVLHQSDRAERLPVGTGVDGRAAIRSIVMDLIRRECQ